MQISFVRSEKITGNIYAFWFKPEKRFGFQAGQFANFTIKHEADDRGQQREFTLSSSPTEENIAFTTSIAPDSSSFKKKLLKLKTNETAYLGSPIGDFILPIDKNIPLIFIAGGTGITPF